MKTIARVSPDESMVNFDDLLKSHERMEKALVYICRQLYPLLPETILNDIVDAAEKPLRKSANWKYIIKDK